MKNESTRLDDLFSLPSREFSKFEEKMPKTQLNEDKDRDAIILDLYALGQLTRSDVFQDDVDKELAKYDWKVVFGEQTKYKDMNFYKHIYEELHKQDFYGHVCRIYTLQSFLFQDLNKALYRGKGGFQGHAKLFKGIHRALLAFHDSKASIVSEVYRGVSHVQGSIKGYQVGQLKTFYGWISTSKSAAVGKRFAKNFLIKIKKVKGLDISKWSRFPGEEQVLIRPGTRFIVTKVDLKEKMVQLQMD